MSTLPNMLMKMVVFVEQQEGPLLLPLVLYVVENSISVKVFTPNCIVVPAKLKIYYVPILN
jgi:hypothetical protein